MPDVFIRTTTGWMALSGGGGGGGGEFYEQPDEPASPGIGAIWVDTDEEPGTDMEVYEQLEEPVTDTIGALWVRQEPA
jgi:hypothetical protein